jgi:hypothetical protein
VGATYCKIALTQCFEWQNNFRGQERDKFRYFPPCDYDLSKCVRKKSGVFAPLPPFFPSLIFHEGEGEGFLYGSG